MEYTRYPPLEAPDVQVLVDDTWRHGVLEAWRKDDEGPWRGFVRWSTGRPGENHLGWYDQDHIRQT